MPEISPIMLRSPRRAGETLADARFEAVREIAARIVAEVEAW